ncbi:MAG: hypothetical protein GXY58_08510 [Planctomycetaceae bacterium]|nr:hypothetical protein [Planctomycetaceae bacterium]
MVLITGCVVGSANRCVAEDHADQLRREIDAAWQVLRDSNRDIQYQMEGVFFTNVDGLGNDESGNPVPPEAATHPARFAWAVDFAGRRFRRDQWLHLFNSDLNAFNHHNTTYVFSGGIGSEFTRHFGDEQARRAAIEPLVELTVNIRSSSLSEHDYPVLWSCGYAPRGELAPIEDSFRPATTSDFTDVRESEDDRTPGRAIAPKVTCRQGLPPGSRRSTLQPVVCS